jgi:structural maintenance of chromosome 4
LTQTQLLFEHSGDLGAIEKQYDIAVSTAVGALDYVVVETASDAQKCVEFLRCNQLGVATFLILEKQKHLASQAAERVQTPEGGSIGP